METELLDFKLKLQSFGALRPEAWEQIVQLSQQSYLKTGQSFIRQAGSLAYVAHGLLKEYDAQHRLEPAIINFIDQNHCIVTRKHNQNHYLKACAPTLVYHWDFNGLQAIYQQYHELRGVYDVLCGEYDEISAFRLRILEEHYAMARIKLFLSKYKAVVPLLKKKDMAKYVQMNYNHFIQSFNQLL